MTNKELETFFKTYLDQIPILATSNADWALLHYVIIFPDICAALENTNGQSRGESYIDWANRYIADPILNGEEWYEIRCHLLHQGITTSRQRYSNYGFKSPEKTGTVTHKYTTPDGALILDVHILKDEILSGLQKWFAFIEGNTNPTVSHNVEVNIASLAGVYPIQTSGGISVASLKGMSVSGTASLSSTSRMP